MAMGFSPFEAVCIFLPPVFICPNVNSTKGCCLLSVSLSVCYSKLQKETQKQEDANQKVGLKFTTKILYSYETKLGKTKQ